MKSNLSGIEYIGRRLRMVRKEKKLTQAKLGELVGNNRAAVQKIENGKSLQPRNTMDLAEALDVNPAWLQFGGPYAMRKRLG
jgi:transcriptional regulator with XRE-family HTH domain